MKTMMKKPAVKKPALKKFAAGGAVAKKKPVKKYADGGAVQMQNMANQGLTMQQMQESRARQLAQAQQLQQMQGAVAPIQFSNSGPVAPQMPLATRDTVAKLPHQQLQQMSPEAFQAAVKKQSQQPIPAAQRIAAMRQQQAMRGRTMMAKGGAVKGKKK